MKYFIVLQIFLVSTCLCGGGMSNSCVELLLINSEGKRVGYDPVKGEVIEEIPRSYYYEEVLPDLDGPDSPATKELEILTPLKDNYVLYIIGISSGPYGVEIYGNNRNDESVVFRTTGTIMVGEIKKIYIKYSPIPTEVTEIFEDNIPPITTLKIPQPKFDAFNTAYISPNTLLWFESTDPVVGDGASGVKYTEYRIDGGSWVTYTTTFTISTEGQHIIEYRSVDNIGNTEEIRSSVVFVTIIPNYGLVGIDEVKLAGKIGVEGNIISNNDVYLRGCVFVNGDVYGRGVYITKKSTVVGVVVETASSVNSYPIDLTAIIEKVSKENDNNKIPLTTKGRKPTDKKARLVLHNDTLTLSTGTYYFTGINITGISELKTDGFVSIFCTGDIRILGRIKINNNDSSDKLVIFVSTYIVTNDFPKHRIEDIFGKEDEDIVVEDIFDGDEMKQILEGTNVRDNSELNIDSKGRLFFKRDKKVRVPNIYIGGKTGINSTIYAPRSKLMMLGFNNYNGNIFVGEIDIVGKATVKNPNFVVQTATISQVVKFSMDNNQPGVEFRLRDVYVYPNPAKQINPKIHIECGIADKVEIKIYNIAGELVHTKEITGLPNMIHNGRSAYEYEWDVKDVSSGVYICYIYAKKSVEKPIKVIKKFAVVK